MKAVVQRVSFATVSVDGEIMGSCGRGMLAFVAVHKDDSVSEAKALADKIAALRIFNDEEGKMNLSVKELEESDRARVLAVSNFTLYGDVSKSRRPSFTDSADYDQGQTLFAAFVEALQESDLSVEAGVFGAHMNVELENDGPVTLIVEAKSPVKK